MQLDRVPPPHSSLHIGTTAPPAGVLPSDASPGATAARPLRRPGAREWALVAAVTWSLLGLGQRCEVDSRLTSPSRTLRTYWEALSRGDEYTVAECYVAGPHDLPCAGMLWFMPPTKKIVVDGFRSLPVESGRVMVTYDVRFLPEGSRVEQTFRTGNELVRERGEWRIARPLGEASMPEWRPIPRAVDS